MNAARGGGLGATDRPGFFIFGFVFRNSVKNLHEGVVLMRKILSKQAAVLFVLLMAFAVSFGQTRSVDAAANIMFNATRVDLPGGQTVITGNFVNHGNEGATVRSAVIEVQITDANGRPIWSDSCNFTDVDVWVPAGASHTHAFHIHNGNCPNYNGNIKWHVNADLVWES